MGRRSNILLVDEDGTVLECIRHVPASQNRYRVSLPGYLYVPPPAQPKVDALTLTAGRLAQVLGKQEPTSPLWQKLVASLRGVSPLLAREVVYRMSGDVGSSDADVQSVLAQLRELLSLAETGQWQPSIALEGDRVIAYAPYVLTQYPHRQALESISVAMAAYEAQRERVDPYAVAKSRWQEIIAEQRGRLGRKRAALLEAQPDPEVLEELRSSGEWLLAYASQIRPGQAEWIVRTEDGQPALRIPLDPTRSAVENAQGYFRRYEKAKSAAVEVPGLLAQVDVELAYLEQLAIDLALAEDQPGIVAVEGLLAEAGYLPKAQQVKRPAVGPLRVLSEEGFVIWVGRNAWQNEEVTFRRATGADVWLHAQGMPGAHVLVRAQGQTVPEATLQRAAELAAYYSSARRERKVAVDHTQRKNVRRIPGGRPGQVTYKGQKTVIVSPKA
jgi:predicted ribosome quality control (RQC) complex YloA/Tae2 family protein